MRTETRTKTIERPVYIAFDGTEFELRADCEKYESENINPMFESLKPRYFPVPFVADDYYDASVYIVRLENETEWDVLEAYEASRWNFRESYFGMPDEFPCCQIVYSCDAYYQNYDPDKIADMLEKALKAVREMERE